MSKELVSIIVVSAGNKKYLGSCLESLLSQNYGRTERIVIDTANAEFKGISYAQALNQGIARARGKFVLCLNDDVILDKDFIKEGLSGFTAGENIGMVSGKVLRFDRMTIDSTGLFLSIWRTARERGYGLKDKGQFEQQGFIFAVSGAVAFYRKEALEQIKLGGEYFDNDFGFFYEDLDVAWRLQRLGFKGYYIPKAVAYHLRGLSVRQGRGIDRPFARRFLSDALHARLIRNRYLAMLKNESLLGFLWHLPFIFLYDCASLGFVLLFNRRVISNFLRDPGCFKSAFRKRKLINMAITDKPRPF